MAEKKNSGGQSGGDEHTEMPADMATMFIMDLMRQKKEKVMRMKKDEMINEMAMKQKAKMNQERSASEYRFSDGTGFMGVHNVQKFSLEPTPAAASGKKFRFKKRKCKWEEDEEEQKQA